MTVLQLLENINEKQTELIIREYEAMPSPDYMKATIRARISASSIRKATWTMFSMAHVNSLLMGLRKIKYNQSYSITRLLSAVECYSFGVIGQGGLTYQEFNLSIGPVAGVLAPELFVEEQSWTIEPIVETKWPEAFRAESYRMRKPKKTDEENLIEQVDRLVREATASARQPVAVRPVESVNDDNLALQIMLAASKKT